MILYIKVIDGQPIDHPSLESNLLETFGEIPAEYQPFVRINPLSVPKGHFEKIDLNDYNYEFVDGVWTDRWVVSPMTEEEIVAKKQIMINGLAAARQDRLDHVNEQLKKEWPAKWRYSLLDYKERIEAYTPPADPWNYTDQQLHEGMPVPREFDKDGNLINNQV